MNNSQYENSKVNEMHELSLTSMVIGIFGLLLFCIPFFGFICSVTAIIMGYIAKPKYTSNLYYKGKAFVLVGIITGYSGLILQLSILLVIVFSSLTK